MRFVEVVNPNGVLQSVPEDWLSDPLLGRGLRKSAAQLRADGELGDPPAEDSKVGEIEAFAERAGIDLSDAKNKQEKLAAVQAALSPEPVPEPTGNPDVQTVFGESMTDNPRPALNEPTETPTAGAEEN